jgi:menaquinone-9 beta-reductase
VFDVVVVGAGPAGSAAALTAQRLGLCTVLVDQSEFPRDKTCGDGLTTQALRLLDELAITPKLLRADDQLGYLPVRDIVLRSPSGRRVDLRLTGPGDYAAVISRRHLDACLVDAVANTDVDLRTAFPIDAIRQADDHVVVSGPRGSVAARWVVAADGHWSTVRKLVHPDRPAYLGEWHAVRQYHANVDTDRLWVLFERDLLPGYAWVFPLPGGHANVGYGVLRKQGRTGRELKALWTELLGRPEIREVLGARAAPIESVRAWPIPTRYRPADLAHGRVLFVGDAAAVVDPMTGEGIAQAIETGILAARAVRAERSVVDTYRRSVHDAIGRDLRFATMLSRVLASPLGARGAIRTVDLNDWTRRQFGRWMFEDYPRAALFTPKRWGRMRPHHGVQSA